MKMNIRKCKEKINEVYNKLIGIYNCLQNQLYHQIERIEILEYKIIEIEGKLNELCS